jgi:2-keto-4-pentenoate hydratase/2-oxohepta-3-ene-1,7-dioic acid hydratase in catechol pathway
VKELEQMLFVRYRAQGRERMGVLRGGTVTEICGSYFSYYVETEKNNPLEEVTLLAPSQPSKVVVVGLMYQAHIEELGWDAPEEPLISIKPSTSVVGPGEPVLLPPGVGRVDYEGEVGIVIGKKMHDVAPEDVGRYILGVTCVNDITARELQAKDGQWTRAKGFDTFCPMGPAIAMGLDLNDIDIRTEVNGEVCQESNTQDFIRPAEELLSFISRIMTLLPGDVIATGTPEGVGGLKAGDEVAVTVEGVGTLINRAVDA